MESWLVSLENQEVPIQALGRSFSFRAWEGIHVECSHKYDLWQIEKRKRIRVDLLPHLQHF